MEKTIYEFIADNGITMRAEPAMWNPNMDSDAWSHSAYHWRVTMFRKTDGKRKQYTTYFSMGRALQSEPKLADVLDCIACDARSVESSTDYKSWADEFGYGIGYERTYRICQRQARAVKRFLGDSLYDSLMYRVESL